MSQGYQEICFEVKVKGDKPIIDELKELYKDENGIEVYNDNHKLEIKQLGKNEYYAKGCYIEDYAYWNVQWNFDQILRKINNLNNGSAAYLIFNDEQGVAYFTYGRVKISKFSLKKDLNTTWKNVQMLRVYLGIPKK